MFHHYAQLTQEMVSNPQAITVIPLAAMEAHGPHLPLGTDGIIVDGILDHAAALDQSAHAVYRLPTLWLGASEEHVDHPGTLSLNAEQMISQIVAIGEGLAHCGLRRVMLFNAHGGNVAAAAIAALKLRTRFGMLVASAHWLDFGLPDGFTAPGSVMADVHGGWVETSILLHVNPQLVSKELPPPAPPATPTPSLFPNGNIQWGWKTSDLAQGGYIGWPDLATAAIGRALTAHAAERLVQTLCELADAKWAPQP
ncbi:MAG: creatininase family protein [Alphaproteobacteria bacterium]|nr:creatininase family protein [Alphaproteobacteria bacterium]PHY00460.1 MAG: creatininase [Rhodospirillaceae bacterium]